MLVVARRAPTRTRTCSSAALASPAAAYSEPRLKREERAVEALGDLALEQLDVAARLLLGVADRAEVAEVVDPHVGDVRGARGGSAGRCWAICSWMRPSKRRPGRLRKTRSALWVTAVPSSSVAGVVRLQQVEGLAPGLAGQRAQALAVALDEDLVGVEEHEPVAGRGVEGDVAGVAEGAGPLEVDELRAELQRDLARAVGRAGVDDDELVDGVADGGEAAREHLLLVLDDHAEAQREALGRARRRRRRACRAGRGRAARRGRRAGAAAAAGARGGGAASWSRLFATCGEVRVQAARGLEEALGGAQLAELVEGDARDVQEAGLARLDLEQLDGAARDDGERAGEDGAGSAGASCRPTSSSAQARLVAAVDVLDLVGARRRAREYAGDVARGQRGARARQAELGAGGAGLRGRRRRGQRAGVAASSGAAADRRRAMVGGPQQEGDGSRTCASAGSGRRA